MKRKILLVPFLLMSICSLFAQKKDKKKETLSASETSQLLSQLVDPANFLREAGSQACGCVDSIDIMDKTKEEVTKAVGACIDKYVGTYQLMMKMNESLKGGSNNITLYEDKNSNEYKKYYYQVERWLKDSCSALEKKIGNNEKHSDFSLSDNEEAIQEYNLGIPLLNEEKFSAALTHFLKAVEIDSKFAFAWDNVGICNRKLGNYDKAIDAYEHSLKADPKGITPLQNIPVAYEYKKEYEKALQGYKNISLVYPNDPEAYYGAGRIYNYYLIDLEKALDNMCKAYNAYVAVNSPYRVDAENNISEIYTKMKAAGNEKLFYKILKDNNLNPEKKGKN